MVCLSGRIRCRWQGGYWTNPGTFGENGVVPTAIIKYKNKLFLHYAGYQFGQKVRFYVLGGLAISKDNGNSFIRYSNTPILERTDEALFLE